MSSGPLRVAVVGTGVIGSGWAARCLGRGHSVVAWDPGPDAETRLREAVERAWPAMVRLGTAEDASPERLTFVADLESAVEGVDFVQESAPERLLLKQELHARLDAATPPDVVIASSTSGLLPTGLQAGCANPQRLVVGHPFHPVYLLPLVEVVGGEATAPHSIERACAFYRGLGMRPLRVRKEVEGFLADRLMEALWREALWLVNDGVATTEELDAAITYGCGLRWSLMGTFLTFHLAGGDGGMRHMLDQFGPALELPWTRLMAPKLTEALTDRIVEGCEHQAAGRSVAELEVRRDEFLTRLLALVHEYWPESEGLVGRI